MSTVCTRTLALAGSLFLGLVAGCSSSGGSGGGGNVTLNSLAGNVRASGGAGLVGVTVRAGNATAISDANGDFILTSVGMFPTGTAIVEFDGTTAGVANQFPILDVLVPLTAGQTTAVMPQVITLPDLTNPQSSMQAVMTAMDGSTAAAISVMGPRPDIQLAAPMGTIITVNGMTSAGMVNLQVTPVPMEEVPMPLPGQMVASSFVTIQPGNSAFDPPGAPVGLDVVIPNDAGFPIGQMVDIWSFDHDDGEWVNRSAQTGERGVVVDAGGGMTEIQASGVITEGGWHAGAIPVDTTCSTMVTGRVIDSGTMEPIEDASIVLYTGQFGGTDAMGNFSFPAVPAYDNGQLAGMPSVCAAVDLCYEVVLPPSYGSVSSGKVTLPAAMVMTGGTTALGDIGLAVPAEGSLSGIVNGDGAMMNEAVMITNTGGPVTSIVPNENGTFFINGLASGPYTAAYTFLGQGTPTEVDFTIATGELTSINIQGVSGGGTQTITVHVYQQTGDVQSELEDVDGAAVTLRGTDSGSMNGIVGTTTMSGTTVFQNVTGPFDVTAQKDSTVGQTNVRFARSLIDVESATGTINILLPELDVVLPVADATLMGTVANPPVVAMGQQFAVRVSATVDGAIVSIADANVDMNGDYSTGVPSGADVDAVLFLADTSGLGTDQPVGTIFALDLGQIASGNSLTQDFDWNSASRVDWDQAVSFTTSGAASAMNSREASVEIRSASDGTFFSWPVIDDSPAGAFAANLPDVTDAGLAGLEVWIDSELETNSTDQYQEFSEQVTANSASFAIDYITAPTLTQPFDSASYTVAQAEALNVSWNPNNAASGGTNGIEDFSLTGFSQGGLGGAEGGVNGVPPNLMLIVWGFFARQGTTTFPIPPTSLPMFESGQVLTGEVSKVRFEGYTIDYDAFWSGDLAVDLPALFNDFTKERSSSNEVGFTIQ